MRGWTLIVGLLMAILLGGGLGMTLGARIGLPPLGTGLGLAVLCGAIAYVIASRGTPTRRLAAGAQETGGGGPDVAWLTVPSHAASGSSCGDSGSDGGSCDGGGDGGGD